MWVMTHRPAESLWFIFQTLIGIIEQKEQHLNRIHKSLLVSRCDTLRSRRKENFIGDY